MLSVKKYIFLHCNYFFVFRIRYFGVGRIIKYLCESYWFSTKNVLLDDKAVTLKTLCVALNDEDDSK